MSPRGGMSLGDHILTEDGSFSSMVGGTLTVAEGVTVEVTGMVGDNMVAESWSVVSLKGMVAGDLIIHTGAQVEITGMVAGAVLNNGGRFTGTGMVPGTRLEGEGA